LDAKVWDEQLQVPIVIYHEFVPNYMNTDATQMRLADFEEELQMFYDNGFSLVSLKGWLEGNMDVPEGRKPLILTIDDVWHGNHLYIQPDGNPSKYSGLGALWYFSQEHPDFGYHASVFAIYGDKYYPEKQIDQIFIAAENIGWDSSSWHIKLGNTIAWALEHNIEVYNHTFLHPYNWPQLSTTEVQTQLAQNDYWLRQFLHEANRDDLIPQLDNMIALPEGKWPESDSGKNVVLNYKNTEDEPVIAVMEAYNIDAARFTDSAFSKSFDRFHIARITASRYMTQYIVENRELVPTMMVCKLGPLDEALASNIEVMQGAIQAAINSQSCPEGVYNVAGNVFLARGGLVTLIKTQMESTPIIELTVTPTATP
jgi:hypothetical protein